MPALTTSSSGFSRTLVIDHTRCRRVPALIACSILLALAALGFGGLPPLESAFTGLLILAYGLRELRNASPRAPRYVSRLEVAPDGRYFLVFAGEPGKLVPVVVVSTWTLPGIAVGLAFAGKPAGRAELIVFRDRVPPDAWRHLAVRLRHALGAGEGAPENITGERAG